MTNDSCDFPAAHSMDTTWFAVDREGHVAVLDSGEPGAVPETVKGQDDDEAREPLKALPEIGEPSLDMAALVHPGYRAGIRPRKRKVPVMWPDRGSACFLVVERERAVDEVARAVPEVVVRRLGDLTVVALASREHLPRDDPRVEAWTTFMRTAHASPWLVTAVASYGDEVDLARRGVFVYRAHDDRYNIAEPYGRVFVPPQPLRLFEMPEAVQKVLATRPRLDLSFAAEAYVQPAEHVPCATWSSAIYLARDGRTVRPIRGHEAEYEEEAAVLEEHEDFEPVIFDPPLRA